MRKIHKRYTYDQLIAQEDRKLPILNQSQFSAKLDDLLDRVSVQNRYASRISHCNMKNLQELEQAKNELKKIAEEKKMEQLKANDTKDLIEQMSQRVKDSQSQLQKIFKEVVIAKKEIKHLKTIIVDLQNQNMLLEKQLLQAKRQKWEQISIAKQQVDQALLSSQVGHFLISSLHTSSFLYKYCLAAHKSNSYESFFDDLDKKIQKEFKNRERIGTIQSLDKKINLNTKFKIGKNLSKDLTTRMKRHKTEHNHIPEALQELNDSID